MTQCNTYTAYCHTNAVNGKKYVGITKRKPEYRWGKDGNGYKGSARFENAIKKYGWDNFKHEIILSGLSKDEAENAEIRLIKEFNSSDEKYGYNLALGGKANEFTESTRKKLRKSWEKRRIKFNIPRNPRVRKYESLDEYKKVLSERMKSPEMREKQRMSVLGRKHTNEEIEKMSKSHIGHKPYRRTPVYCVDTGKMYMSTCDAERDTGINHSNITRCCKGRTKRAGGYVWEYGGAA